MFEQLFSRFDSIVLFDTETTGLNPEKGDRIIELAAVRMVHGIGGIPVIDRAMDNFLSLPSGKVLPPEITKLTGITPERLQKDGIPTPEAISTFLTLTGNGAGKPNKPKVLLIAHNAQFDAGFLRPAIAEYIKETGNPVEAEFNFLDTLTMYKDRRNYPHRLENAISAYNLDGKVKNSHRAIDDVEGLFAVLCEMEREYPNTHEYVNHFGYNPKYGVSGRPVKGVSYHEQASTYHRVGIEKKPFFSKRGAGESR